MRVGDVFPSEFLKSADIGGIAAGKRVRVTIADVKFWEDSTGARKLSIGFKNTKKRLLANVTNSRMIARHYGEETDGWIGREIILFVQLVDFRGTPTEALRVIIDPVHASPPPARLPANEFVSGAYQPPRPQVQQPVQNPAPPVDNVDAFGLAQDLNDEIPF